MKEKFYSKNISLAQETDEIKAVAKKLGIVLPSTHTALFQAIYAPIEEKNLNGIRLARKAVEDALPGMISSQSNLEHYGQGFMTGIILSAWINSNDEIEIVFTFAKNLYPDDYEKAVELLEKGELSVSFELLAETDAQEELSDGSIRLNSIDFQGVGLLLDNPPAYPKAKVYEYAKALKERLSHCKDRELVCASVIENTCDKILSEDMSDEPIAMPENIYLISSTEDGHFHVAKIDWDGNGTTISTMGTDKEPHMHEIVNWQFQKADGHAHRIMNEIMAKVKEDIDAVKKQSNYIHSLPDSSFAIIEPAYLDGKTTNKKARHLPFKDRNGKINLSDYDQAVNNLDKISPITDSISTEDLRSKAKEELDKHKEEISTSKKNEIKSTQGGNSTVKLTDEQKAKIDEIRAELGDFAKEIKDEDLLSDEVVAEIRKEKADKEAEAKSEIEKANEKITELEAKVEELTSTLSAKDSEIEEVRANAEKIGKTKTQLKDNEFAKDFSDEDYLDDEKVAKAEKDAEDAKTVATRKEELKDNPHAKEFKDEDYLNEDKVELAKVKLEADELKAKAPKNKVDAKKKDKEEDLETGDNDEDEPSEYNKVIASIRKDSKENYKSNKIYAKKQ